MMIVANGMAVNKFLYGKLSYDPVKNFAPVSLIAVVPNVLVTNAAQSKAKTVAEVIAQAKAQPGKVTYASAGNGTSIHLAGELFASMAQVDMLHVPYKGSGPAVTDLIGGQVDYMFDSITSAIAAHPVRQAARDRRDHARNVRRRCPTCRLSRKPGCPATSLSPWFAVYMPAGTAQPIVGKMNAALLEAMKLPEVKARLPPSAPSPSAARPNNSRPISTPKWPSGARSSRHAGFGRTERMHRSYEPRGVGSNPASRATNQRTSRRKPSPS